MGSMSIPIPAKDPPTLEEKVEDLARRVGILEREKRVRGDDDGNEDLRITPKENPHLLQEK